MASFQTIASCNTFMIENCSSYEEFISAVLKKIREEDDGLLAFEYVAETEALSAARELDAMRATHGTRAGEPIAGLPLVGIPVAIKDIIDVAGMPTTFGCEKAPIGYPRLVERARFTGTGISNTLVSDKPINFATQDAAVVRLLKAKGAIIIGKVVTTQLAGLIPSRTLNPRDRNRTPGESSSGSAASVGAGLVPLSVGTQT